jgi:hypothetical protein
VATQFLQLVKYIQGQFGEDLLDFNIAAIHVIEAYNEILKSRTWSFGLQSGTWYSPSIITAGSVSITQFSTTFTVNNDGALAAWQAAAASPYPPINQRQIRFGSVQGGGTSVGASIHVYSVLSFDGLTGIGKLDSGVQESTSTASQYQLYRSLYGPPWTGSDIQSLDPVYEIINVADPVNNYSFDDITLTQALLNQQDPQRSQFGGNPYYLASAPYDANGNPQWEMYPSPTAAIPYLVDWQMQGLAPESPSQVGAFLATYIPARLQPKTIREAAMVEACKWAMKQRALAGVNWMQALQAHERSYEKCYMDDARDDDEIVLNSFHRPPPLNLVIGDDDRTGYYSISPGNFNT